MGVCLISAKPVAEGERYSRKAVAEMFGHANIDLRLPFTRADAVNGALIGDGMSISGVQPKLSIRLDGRQLQPVGQNGQFILKPSPEGVPFLAENEFLSMRLAASLGLTVPPCALLPFADSDELAFLIRRYDRTDTGARIHQEQLDGAMGVSDKYGNLGNGQYVSYARAGLFIASHMPGVAPLRDFFRQVLLAYVIGNSDLHLRNFSIFYPDGPGRPPRLAPVYDMLSVEPHEQFKKEYLALDLLLIEEDGKTLAPGFDSPHSLYLGSDFLLFAADIGLPQAFAKNEISRMVRMEAIFHNHYCCGILPKNHATKIMKTVTYRLKRLLE